MQAVRMSIATAGPLRSAHNVSQHLAHCSVAYQGLPRCLTIIFPLKENQNIRPKKSLCREWYSCFARIPDCNVHVVLL